MAFGLTEADLELQTRSKSFVDDELIPWEVHAEMNNGEIPDDVRDRHEKLARDLGLTAINQPAELGGHGYTTMQQVLIAEQSGRVTNALGWLISTPPGWLPQVATPYQMERYVLPTIAGEKHECYAITEENAGSDVSDLEATARRDGDEYVLNGIKWHVTSANLADYLFFQGKAHRRPQSGPACVVHRRYGHTRSPAPSHTGLHPHLCPSPLGDGIRGRASASLTPGR